jgi:large subunit ribosomal protein L22
MEITAQTKSVRVSPRKVRLVADAIRKLSVKDAIRALEVIKNRGAFSIEKTLKSAIANAVTNAQQLEEALFIKSVDVVEGPAFKRFHASTRGRIHPYKKKSSHIRIVLGVKATKQVATVTKETSLKETGAETKNEKSKIKNEEKENK